MRNPQQGPGTPEADGYTTSGRRRKRLRPATKSERANALALWHRAFALGAGRGVANANGLPPRSMAAMLLRASRTRLQAHLFLPLRLDDRYLVRIVAMKERKLLRQAERRAHRCRQAPPIAPQD